MRKGRLRIGAHVSIAGGLHKALSRGAEAGCDVIQVFTKSGRTWAERELAGEEVQQWEAQRGTSSVEPAMSHASYLINVGNPDAAAWRRSYEALRAEYGRCETLRIPYLVLHPGAHLGTSEAEAIGRIGRALRRLFDGDAEKRTMLLLENTAGQGTCVGHRFEHLRDLFAAVDRPGRMGVCLDTCHLLAAGYDITTGGGWERVMEELQQKVGTQRVRAFHVNDSKRPVGCRVDRHEHLGRGYLGLPAIRCLVNDARFVGLPMVLETPKETEWADAINLEILRSLAGRKRVGSRARRLAAQSLQLAPLAGSGQAG